jgi:hypothetical protein
MKQRIDQLLVERGFTENLHKAQALLLAGHVLVKEQKVEKPGFRLIGIPKSAFFINSNMPAGQAPNYRRLLMNFIFRLKGLSVQIWALPPGGLRIACCKMAPEVCMRLMSAKASLHGSCNVIPG